MCGYWKGDLVYFVSIYSSYFLDKKRKLWRDLEAFKNKFPVGASLLGGILILSGLNPSEKMGTAWLIDGSWKNSMVLLIIWN